MTSFNELPSDMKTHILRLTGNPVKAAAASKEFDELVNAEAQLCFDTLASSQDDIPSLLKSSLAQISKYSSISSLERIKLLYQIVKNAGYDDKPSFASLQPDQIMYAFRELKERQDQALLTILPKIAKAASLSDPGSISAEEARKWMENNSSSISSIKRLDLKNCELKVLPPEIGQLKKLEKLDVSRNLLTALPEELWQLRGLRQLTLVVNQLTSISPKIGDLSELSILLASHNPLTTFPKEIVNCKNLSMLNVPEIPGFDWSFVPKEIDHFFIIK